MTDTEVGDHADEPGGEIARDTAAALTGSGADVPGPCRSEEAALDLLDGQAPTQAILDLNLGGGGPRFGIVPALKARGVRSSSSPATIRR